MKLVSELDKDTRQHVLLTGAAGRIGRTFFETFKDRYRFRLTDLPGLSWEVESPHEWLEADLRDYTALDALCAGVETIVHLAGVPLPNADFETVLEHNIWVTQRLFEAARVSACRRVVLASSAQTIEGYPVDVQVGSHMPTRPKNLYGISKVFGENLASYYADVYGLSSIAVRIGAFEFPETHELTTTRDLSAFISPRDLCQLLELCIVAQDIHFFIAHGISNNRFKRLDLTETKKVLGYKPQDDAFQMFDIPIDTLKP
jgi:uronate dehydrogenase